MKCEHTRCPDDAEVWVAVNEKPVRLCSKHHRFATRDGAWVETFWEADIDGLAPTPSRRPAPETPAPVADVPVEMRPPPQADPVPVKPPESFAAAQVEEPPGPPAEATPEVVHPPIPMATAPPVPSGRIRLVRPKTLPPRKTPRGGRPPRTAPLILRVDADAHPELCRIADCPIVPWRRGLCDPHVQQCRRAKRTDEFGLPPKTKTGPRERVNRAGVPCAYPGCVAATTAHGWCPRELKRIAKLGLDRLTVTGADLESAWTSSPSGGRPGRPASIRPPEPVVDTPVPRAPRDSPQTIDHTFLLRRDFRLTICLPADFDDRDAKRLIRFIEVVVLPPEFM